MKKRIYRAIDVKALNLDELRKVVKNQNIVLGVDVAKEDFVAALMNEKREVLSTIKWKHPMETGMLLDVMLHKLPWSSLDVAMEPSGTYGDALRALFIDNSIKVYRVSPKRCHDAGEVYDGVPSLHDPKAAAIIGRLHLDGASEEWPLPEKAQRELRAAIKTMELYDDAYYRNINRLESILARHWPEVTRHLKLTSATLLELIIAFGCPERVAAEPEKAAELMLRVGRSNLLVEKIDKVVESAQQSLGVSCIEEERRHLMELCGEIRRLQQEAMAAQKRVEMLIQDIESVNVMIDIIGKKTAAVLHSELGDVSRYDNAGSYVKSIGLNLKEHSSGKHKGKLKITKRGSGTVRMYLYLAVLRLIQKNSIIQAWYQNKVDRDGGTKMKAVVALMRKLARALWHVGQGKRFDAAKLFDVSRLGFSPV
jgi:transposase